ncbi:phosphoenolpyruvate--protein phosphotransferase [Fodinicurvata sp. EGI_FJ10296]|uniref:phosphoenolpyruvate--protein phosphotransferase n=1 Tax=Fodinicurvata sp. EGI_FJ10296 TaxID=3231908 RepID=UPI0034522EDB
MIQLGGARSGHAVGGRAKARRRGAVPAPDIGSGAGSGGGFPTGSGAGGSGSGGGSGGGAGGGGHGPTASRRLLARLRDIMAGSGSAQERLDKIVRMIAAEMVAEVCSCYVMRPGEVLELFATIGLNPDAVHRTRLQVGQGLVGEVAATARAQVIANAPQHPKFVYRPETGEDPYQSFMGVPILRGGKVRGVLVIQNQQRRTYSEEEVETLLTIAMVVAELVAARGPSGPDQAGGIDANEGMMPARIEGVTLNPGLAMGTAVPHRPQLTIRQMVAEDADVEHSRLRDALAAMHSSIDHLVAVTEARGDPESRDILETYRMFAEDRGWLNRINEAISTGLTAEASVQRVQNDMRARMAHMTDPYLRERINDFEDLANRLLLHLSGKTSVASSGTLPEAIVLVARSLGPADLLDYDQEKLVAVVLEDGSSASHVAILARALGLPMVARCADVMQIVEPFDQIIVDGDNAQVFVRPAEDVQDLFAQTLALRAERAKEYAGLIDKPALSRDGVCVSLQINAGLMVDLAHLHEVGADGVGLFRTEIPFMVRSSYPDVEAQTDLYTDVFDRADGKLVSFRTLDIGGDKALPYFPHDDRENPALGWRAIRIGLDRPAMLRQQIRALVGAARGRPFRLMFPMVAHCGEFDAARKLAVMECERARRRGQPVSAYMEIGVMLEVPALIWQLDDLLARADFVSIGSNDLMQYLFAADRGNPHMATRYDALCAPMIDVLEGLAARAAAAGVPISVCGEMAGRPLDAMVLVALGFRTLSMSSGSVGPVKAMIRSLDVAALRAYLETIRRLPGQGLREKLRSYARDSKIAI